MIYRIETLVPLETKIKINSYQHKTVTKTMALDNHRDSYTFFPDLWLKIGHIG